MILKISKIVALLLVIVVGLWVRFNDISFWAEQKQIFYLSDDRPLYTSYDSYYFARFAYDLSQGLYHAGETDPYRFVPDNFLTDNFTYPFPPPLLSVSLSFLSSVLKKSYELISFYYPSFGAILFVIPLFLLFEDKKLFPCGLLASLTGVLGLIYVVRTGLCRLDTDFLILFFVFLSLYFLWQTIKRESYFWALLSGFSLLVFYWWYSKPYLMFSEIIVFLFAFYWKVARKPTLKDFYLLALIILPNIWFLWKAPFSLFVSLQKLVLGITKTQNPGIFSDYPNVLRSISELQTGKYLWSQISFVVEGWLFFLLGILGVLFFFIKERPFSFLFLPYFFIGLLVFRSGNRFAMYLSPFIGIGLGYIIYLAFLLLEKFQIFRSSLSKRDYLSLLVTIIFGVLVVLFQKNAFSYVAVPKIMAPVARNMFRLQTETPKNAWLWSWWDNGYPLAYLSRRGVFADGGSQVSPKTYYIARSFTTNSPLEMWNIISFIANEGLLGIEKRLKAGLSSKELTQKIVRGEFQKPLPRPIYIVFTPDLLRKFGWISFFGTWNFDKKEGRSFVFSLLSGCKNTQKNILICKKNIKINLVKGIVSVRSRTLPLKDIYILKKDKKLYRKTYHQKGLICEIVLAKYGRFIILLDERAFSSLFNQLYILRSFDPDLYQLKIDDFPYFVVYEVANIPRKKKSRNTDLQP